MCFLRSMTTFTYMWLLISNLLLIFTRNLQVEKKRKSVKVWQNYDHEFVVSLSWPTLYNNNSNNQRHFKNVSAAKTKNAITLQSIRRTCIFAHSVYAFDLFPAKLRMTQDHALDSRRRQKGRRRHAVWFCRSKPPTQPALGMGEVGPSSHRAIRRTQIICTHAHASETYATVGLCKPRSAGKRRLCCSHEITAKMSG